MATAQDIPLLIVSENSASERRISPSWTIAQLKGRLEPVTGVPATCQKLSLKIGSQAAQPIEAADEESTILAAWPLQAYAELKVGMADFSFFPSCNLWCNRPKCVAASLHPIDWSRGHILLQRFLQS
jgi:hypothetical protein